MKTHIPPNLFPKIPPYDLYHKMVFINWLLYFASALLLYFLIDKHAQFMWSEFNWPDIYQLQLEFGHLAPTWRIRPAVMFFDVLAVMAVWQILLIGLYHLVAEKSLTLEWVNIQIRALIRRRQTASLKSVWFGWLASPFLVYAAIVKAPPICLRLAFGITTPGEASDISANFLILSYVGVLSFAYIFAGHFYRITILLGRNNWSIEKPFQYWLDKYDYRKKNYFN